MKIQAHHLLAQAADRRKSPALAEPPNLVQLANLRYAPLEQGSGTLGSFWRPETSRVERTRTEGVYAQKAVTLTENVFAQRDIVERRDILSQRDVYEDRPVFEEQAVFEDRDVFEDQAVYETRTVYQQQEIRETEVTASRSLSGYTRLSTAGIDTGADFAVTVGSNSAAKIKFNSSTRLTVTVGASSQQFSFNSNDGSWRTALVAGLNSVAGLTAALTSDGRLQLSTDDAQSLTIADVANGFLDFSSSPLAALGLTAGTSASAVVGYDSVAAGTEQVQVGTQRVKVGTERIQTGTAQVQVGTQSILAARESYVSGSETVVTGSRHMKVGEKNVTLGSETVRVGSRLVGDGVEEEIVGVQTLQANAHWKRRAQFDYVSLLFAPIEVRQGPAALDEARAGYTEFGATASDDDKRPNDRRKKDD
jgi:hypothetical protein